MATMIHKTAILDKRVEIGGEVEIGPYSVIGKGVRIEKGCKIGSHVVIDGPTFLGEGCKVFSFSSLGAIPQDLKYRGEETVLEIGENNIIREYVTINRATTLGGGKTTIGNNNLLMAYSHIAHDCRIGNHVIMANAATLAGHIHIEDYAIIGGLVAIHQFVRIGAYSLIGGGSAVPKDVPPYCLVVGNRVRLYGLNTVGLKRHNFSQESINNLKKAYRILFRSGLILRQALERVRSEINNSQEVKHLIDFVQNSQRGVVR